MASGMSAARVSRIGLPLSQVSAMARRSRLSSIRAAIRFSIAARSATLVRPQAAFAACAASSAASTSCASERAILQTIWPVTGEALSKYLPELGATNFSADEIVVAFGEGNFGDAEEFYLVH